MEHESHGAEGSNQPGPRDIKVDLWARYTSRTTHVRDGINQHEEFGSDSKGKGKEKAVSSERTAEVNATLSRMVKKLKIEEKGWKEVGNAESRGDRGYDHGNRSDSLWQGGGSTRVPSGLSRRAAGGEGDGGGGKEGDAMGGGSGGGGNGGSGGGDDDGGIDDGDHPRQVEAEGELENELPVYDQLTDIDDMVKQEAESIQEAKREYGERSDEMIGVIKSLAQNYQDHNRNKDAERLRMKVLELHQEIFGEAIDGTIYSMIDLSISLHMQDRYEEASRLLLRALDRFQEMPSKMGGGGRPKFTKEKSELLLSIMAGLEINMKLWHDEGYQEMIRLHLLVIEETLKSWSFENSEDHLHGLESLMSVINQLPSSVGDEENLLASFSRCAWMVCPTSGRIMYAIKQRQGALFSKQERWKEAVEAYEEALPEAIAVYGQASDTVMDHREQLGLALQNLGKHRTAELHFKEALFLAKHLDNSGWRVVNAETNLASFYIKWGKGKKAKDLFKHVFQFGWDAHDNQLDDGCARGDITIRNCARIAAEALADDYYAQEKYEDSTHYALAAVQLRAGLPAQLAGEISQPMPDLIRHWDKLQPTVKGLELMKQTRDLVKDVYGAAHLETLLAEERLETMRRDEATGKQKETNKLNTKLTRWRKNLLK